MAAITPIREDAARQAEDDGVRWLALLLLEAIMVLVRGIRGRYVLKHGEKCPRCGHAF